jgi:Uma2 family endonuclease
MSTTILKLGPKDASMRLSREEFASADFEVPYTYERVRGRLVVMSPPGPQHRQVTRPFYRDLCAYWKERPELVDMVDVEGWVATSEDDDRIPDICVYLAGPASGQDVPQRVPDLIFEFVSQDRADQERDYIHKREEYHRIGVQEYVIVDSIKVEVLVLTWRKDDYAERTLTSQSDYATPLLPGLNVSLKEVFG